MPDDPLLEEYKILLAKIDKIGDNRFIVRGWSATIVLGFLLGASAANVPSYLVLLALPVVGVFYLMEADQNHLQVALMKRATSLERTYQATAGKLYSDPNPYADSLGPVPGIATAINRFGRKATSFQRFARRANFAFYLVEALLIASTFIVHCALGAREDSPRNIYHFNTIGDQAPKSDGIMQVAPLTSEKPNGGRTKQHSKVGPGKCSKGERKVECSEE